MALLWMDGFDHYGTDTTNMTDGAWAEIVGATLATDNPRTGSSSLKIASANVRIRRVLGGAKTTAGLGAVYWFSNLPSTNDVLDIMQFRDAANNEQVTIVLQSTGVIEAFRGDGFTGTSLGDSGSPAVTAEAYTHIETMVTIDNSAGQVEVRVNGVTVLSISGVDTAATANIETSQVQITVNGTQPNPGVTTWYIDDIYCYDDTGSYNNDFIGDRRVYTLFPNADTAQADWSPSTGGDGYAMIDEADPNDDTDYIFTSGGTSPNPVSEFDLDDLPAGVSAVSAVSLIHRSRKTDAGDANIQLSAVSGSFETAGADNPMTEVYTYYEDVIEADPDTAAPFTPTAVDSLKLKIERTQ